MEENEVIKEQPDSTCSVNLTAVNNEVSNDESAKGSLYGKFKNAESLYNGYIELEKEFTRKSQLLNELQKSVVDNTEQVPIYSLENWQSEVDKYMEDKPYAKNFAQAVAKTLMNDHDLACQPNCLELAYNKVLASNYSSYEDMSKNRDFLENYIFNNEEIKSKILNEYLSALKKNTAPPIVLSAKGDSVGVISPTKPKNLGEARKLVEQLFNF